MSNSDTITNEQGVSEELKQLTRQELADLDTEDIVENCVEWIKALADFSYPQTKKVLENSKGAMCCLGVGRVIVDPFGKVAIEEDDYDRGYLSVYQYESLGLYGPNGSASLELNRRPGEPLKRPLIVLNDVCKYSHPEIAKVILSNPFLYLKPEVAEGVLDHFFNR